jgi:hypothetical protein
MFSKFSGLALLRGSNTASKAIDFCRCFLPNERWAQRRKKILKIVSEIESFRFAWKVLIDLHLFLICLLFPNCFRRFLTTLHLHIQQKVEENFGANNFHVLHFIAEINQKQLKFLHWKCCQIYSTKLSRLRFNDSNRISLELQIVVVSFRNFFLFCQIWFWKFSEILTKKPSAWPVADLGSVLQ